MSLSKVSFAFSGKLCKGDSEESRDGSGNADGEPEPDKSPDSQRPGAWMSGAYLAHSSQDRLEKVCVPIEVLFEWMVDRRPSATDFVGTFTKADLRHPA